MKFVLKLTNKDYPSNVDLVLGGNKYNKIITANNIDEAASKSSKIILSDYHKSKYKSNLNISILERKEYVTVWGKDAKLILGHEDDQMSDFSFYFKLGQQNKKDVLFNTRVFIIDERPKRIVLTIFKINKGKYHYLPFPYSSKINRIKYEDQ